jgi:B9 domain-containing protein 2
MAELHIVGEISGGHSFNGQSFFCVYEIVTGVQWSHVEGRVQGSTHIMENSYDGISWNLPIDVHYCFQSIQGWPKISLQVWSLDGFGRKDLAGYGTCFVPMPSAEEQEIDIPTWKPSYWYPNGLVRLYQQVRQMVMGGNPVLRDDSLVHTNDARFKLHTVAGGNVTLKLTVISRRTAALGLRYA